MNGHFFQWSIRKFGYCGCIGTEHWFVIWFGKRWMLTLGRFGRFVGWGFRAARKK